MTLSALLEKRTDIWRGQASPTRSMAAVSSGYPQLDDALGGGWPAGAVVELIAGHSGDGALELTLPALAGLSLQERWITLVDPPFIPFAPGLAGCGVRVERLLWLRPDDEAGRRWALEQALRSGACSAVLGWLREGMKRDLVRRLQLAAERGGTTAFMFLPSATAGLASAAALRLRVKRQDAAIRVEILKRRGGWAPPPFLLSPSSLTGSSKQSASTGPLGRSGDAIARSVS